MNVIVCSKSTRKYAEESFFRCDKIIEVSDPPSKKTLDEIDSIDGQVVAIGGGSVIDTAKIIAKGQVIAFPTNFSGAACTSHAVYWDEEGKHDVKTKVPNVIVIPEWADLPKEAEMASKMDCLCHIMECLISPNASEESDFWTKSAVNAIKGGNWLNASVYAGRALELCGSNIIHGLSYGLTQKYNIPHGIALSHILNMGMKYRKVEELL